MISAIRSEETEKLTDPNYTKTLLMLLKVSEKVNIPSVIICMGPISSSLLKDNPYNKVNESLSFCLGVCVPNDLANH